MERTTLKTMLGAVMTVFGLAGIAAPVPACSGNKLDPKTTSDVVKLVGDGCVLLSDITGDPTVGKICVTEQELVQLLPLIEAARKAKAEGLTTPEAYSRARAQTCGAPK